METIYVVKTGTLDTPTILETFTDHANAVKFLHDHQSRGDNITWIEQKPNTFRPESIYIVRTGNTFSRSEIIGSFYSLKLAKELVEKYRKDHPKDVHKGEGHLPFHRDDTESDHRHYWRIGDNTYISITECVMDDATKF
jgi:hypothetical protein